MKLQVKHFIASQRPSSMRGNMVLLIALLLTGSFALAAFAIDTALYLLKREELQSLAESVALGAVLSFPNQPTIENSTLNWYQALRFQNGKEIAKAPGATVGGLPVYENIITSVPHGTGTDLTPATLNAITILLRDQYSSNILPLAGFTPLSTTVVGQVTAQLSPTNIVIVIDNTASLIVDDGDSAYLSASPYFSVVDSSLPPEHHYPTKPITLIHQCFNETFRNYKKGVVALYDQFAGIGTYRVGIVLTNSRFGEPFVLANLGQSIIEEPQNELDAPDDPEFNYARCAYLTKGATDYLPKELYRQSGTTEQDLSSRVTTNSTSFPHFKFTAGEKLRTREALWVMPAGYSTENGFIHPRYYYQNGAEAIALARRMLQNDTGGQGQPVTRKVILYVTDDAGMGWTDPQQTQGIAQREKITQGLCETLIPDGTGCTDSKDAWNANFPEYDPGQAVQPGASAIPGKGCLEDNLILGVIYYGHRDDLYGHDPSTSDAASVVNTTLRSMSCLKADHEDSRRGIFFHEIGKGTSKFPAKEFATRSAPLIAHALKEAEVLR
ncbi:Tad domain-containing protein [bacterium]|nr:Tad domain-containing protein [bacterium]